MMRVEEGVERGDEVTMTVDGRPLRACAGETVATALLAEGVVALRLDGRGRPRGLFCNMGTCLECVVEIVDGTGRARSVRACMTDVAPGLTVRTGMGA